MQSAPISESSLGAPFDVSETSAHRDNPKPTATATRITSPLRASFASGRDLAKIPNSPPRSELYIPGRALAKWRAIARKVIHLNNASATLSAHVPGGEPGADPRRRATLMAYGHIRQSCVIDIVEYSTVRTSSGRMTNKEFVQYLADSQASEREPWVKVRWINIAGVSWDVLNALALKYDIHPLALENILQQHTQSRSKADYYLKHLYISVLCHSLARDDEEKSSRSITELAPASSPTFMDKQEAENVHNEKDGSLEPQAHSGRLEGEKAVNFDSKSLFPMKRFTSFMHGRSHAVALQAVEELKKGDRVNAQSSPISILLFREGTVITVSSHSNLDFFAPITTRLRQADTTLRASADPSLLVQSLLDLVVDKTLEVVDAYHDKILELETDVLIQPKIATVRSLHILAGDLAMRKLLLEPLKTLIYGLRRYDLDRVASLVEHSSTPNAVIEGFMSHKSKIYLADVYENMEYGLTSIDMFYNIAENLINYSFNLASYDMNEVMRRLTLATIIFLPLTLLTGYFGMNFGTMWSTGVVDGTPTHLNRTDVFFWELALPIMAILVPFFLRRDLVKMVHYIRKKTLVRKVSQSFANLT